MIRTSGAAEPAIGPARPFTLVLVCGCLIALLTFGLRSAFGAFTDPVSTSLGVGRDSFALALALQNLLWGVAQPIGGALADRHGPARVMAVGGVLYAAGLALMAGATDGTGLLLTAGVLVGIGMGGASYVTVIGALGRIAPPGRRSWALGVASAAGSLGQFLVVPAGQAFIGAHGWQTAILLLAALAALVPILAGAFAGTATAAALPEGEETRQPAGLLPAIRDALAHPSYGLLVAGFFVCGFQLAFVTIHLPPYLTDKGLSPAVAAWSIAMVGLFNVVGAYGAGVLGGRCSKKYLLSLIYLARALVTAGFLLLPANPGTALLFGALMGLLWLSTVPLTSGLVATLFGTRYMATLFGLVFLGHQVGSFLGVWLGGHLYARTGSYDVTWWLSVLLSLGAALIHLPIREEPARPRGQVA